MDGPLRVAAPPARPLMIFDGDCGFCRFWVARWRIRLQDRLDFEPSQTAAARFPEIPPEAFARAVQLVLPTSDFFEGAEAVFRALALGGKRWPLWMYAHLAGVRDATELAYEAIAGHRTAATRVTRWLWGTDPRPSTYERSSALFLRLMGLIYVSAFVSLWVQVHGLIGSRGILPVGRFLEWAQSRVPGPYRFWLLPTLCWLDSSDRFLDLLCGAGTAASLLVTAGVALPLGLAAAWFLYLSLAVAGQTFLEFQWDLLLLETGFLAIFLAPPVLRRWTGSFPGPTRAVRLLLWWLLFRLMLSSGIVKLSSGDPTWKSLTALRYHYFTQPLPPWTAWFASHAPPWLQTFSCLLLFAIEFGAPFLILLPRRVRHAAAAILAFLQVTIIATGNYAFFNFLTLALCVLLLDDTAFPARAPAEPAPSVRRRAWPRAWILSMTAVVLVATVVVFSGAFRTPIGWPRPVLEFVRSLAPLRIANGYGLFSVMTTTRPEIIVEGSEDGTRWTPYEFRWKPGDPAQRPAFVAPHQPRLDWQMWFAALGGYEENPWFIQFCARLLEGSPPVTALLARDPFAGRPPRYVRAVVYDYHFTDSSTRRLTGAWWSRESVGLYCPVLSKEILRGE
jgi:predicted DCC family thiol-disulfide oxidoreductase YuxK